MMKKVASILLLFVLLLCNVSLFSACFSEEPSVAQGEKGEKGEQGEKGDKGDAGASIQKIEFDEFGRMIITLTDGTVLEPIDMGRNEKMQLSFDDYLEIGDKSVTIIDAGKSTADQNRAVVTVDEKYLIASGIGTAKVMIDQKVYDVIVEKAKINLIMIMGQSNAGNHFENATSDVTCPIGTAYWWGNNQGAYAKEPVAYTQPSMGFHTPLLAELYAQSVADGNPVKNVMIWHEGITSKNGQSIVKWAESATNTTGTDDAVKMLENCRSYYEAHSDQYEIVSSGVYWLQGESDMAMDPTLYTERFMAMWQRLKSAGMEYLAFLRVRRATSFQSATSDDLSYSSSLSAQIKMINDVPEFYMATTVTENWVGDASVFHTVDISNYITMLEAYGKSGSYTDAYGNYATYSNGKLTTTMKTLYGSNNTCHYGKFGYGILGADAAYNMYQALNGQGVKLILADTSGYASHSQVLSNGQRVVIDITSMTENLTFRAECGSVSGTLEYIVRTGNTVISHIDGVMVQSGDLYGSVSTSKLRNYEDVTIELIYTTTDNERYSAICEIHSETKEPQKDYIWNFDEDLNARGSNGEVLNSFLSDALSGSYSIENGYLVGDALQLQLEKSIELRGDKNWSIEWKYGVLDGGTAGFLLCSNPNNTLGNKGIWHIYKGYLAIADYLDADGYRNYTSVDAKIKNGDCLRLTNTYDPITQKSTISLWINGELAIADFQLKGCLNAYHDKDDMTGYPLTADFIFGYLGNVGMNDWRMNCQLDYLKISFGES